MPEELDGTLGAAVRELRLKQGFTQARLARVAGVSRRHLAALENGANVSVLVVVKIARVLGIGQLPLGDLTLTREPTTEVAVPDVVDLLDQIDRLTAEARRRLVRGPRKRPRA